MKAIFSTDWVTEDEIVSQHIDGLGPMPPSWWKLWAERSQFFDENGRPVHGRYVWPPLDTAFAEWVQAYCREDRLGEFSERRNGCHLAFDAVDAGNLTQRNIYPCRHHPLDTDFTHDEPPQPVFPDLLPKLEFLVFPAPLVSPSDSHSHRPANSKPLIRQDWRINLDVVSSEGQLLSKLPGQGLLFNEEL